ncbi:MAG: nuclear transport factor 2 family protein [Phycisphaerales bacterium]|nr:nuclear transport factor 2 family protein [Phycisphaerales bacterium]
MRALLFENPYALIPVLLVVDLFTIWFWSRRRTRRTARTAVGALVASVVLAGLQSIVVTDRERVVGVCRAMATAAGRGDVDAFADLISGEFDVPMPEGRPFGKAELVEAFRRGFARWNVEEERVADFDVTVADGRAHASFTVGCRLISDDVMLRRHVSRWRVDLVQANGDWFVTGVTPVRTPVFPFDSLGDVVNYDHAR